MTTSNSMYRDYFMVSESYDFYSLVVKDNKTNKQA